MYLHKMLISHLRILVMYKYDQKKCTIVDTVTTRAVQTLIKELVSSREEHFLIHEQKGMLQQSLAHHEFYTKHTIYHYCLYITSDHTPPCALNMQAWYTLNNVEFPLILYFKYT